LLAQFPVVFILLNHMQRQLFDLGQELGLHRAKAHALLLDFLGRVMAPDESNAGTASLDSERATGNTWAISGMLKRLSRSFVRMQVRGTVASVAVKGGPPPLLPVVRLRLWRR
jgi:hypothetical protein